MDNNKPIKISEVWALPENWKCETEGKKGILLEDCRGLSEGSLVWEYTGETFGCLSPNEIAVCSLPKTFPFTGVPRNIVKWD